MTLKEIDDKIKSNLSTINLFAAGFCAALAIFDIGEGRFGKFLVDGGIVVFNVWCYRNSKKNL